MIYGFLAGAGVLVGGLVSYVLKRAFGSAKPTGLPTSDEAKINAQTTATAGEIAARGEQQKEEVSHASKDDLLAKFRDSLRRK